MGACCSKKQSGPKNQQNILKEKRNFDKSQQNVQHNKEIKQLSIEENENNQKQSLSPDKLNEQQTARNEKKSMNNDKENKPSESNINKSIQNKEKLKAEKIESLSSNQSLARNISPRNINEIPQYNSKERKLQNENEEQILKEQEIEINMKLENNEVKNNQQIQKTGQISQEFFQEQILRQRNEINSKNMQLDMAIPPPTNQVASSTQKKEVEVEQIEQKEIKIKEFDFDNSEKIFINNSDLNQILVLQDNQKQDLLNIMYDKISDKYLKYLDDFKIHLQQTKNFDQITEFYEKFLSEEINCSVAQQLDLQFPVNFFDGDFPRSLSQIQRQIQEVMAVIYQKSSYMIQSEIQIDRPPFEILQIIRSDAKSIQLKILVSQNILNKNETNSDILIIQKFYKQQYFEKCQLIIESDLYQSNEKYFCSQLMEIEDQQIIIFEGCHFSLHDILKLKIIQNDQADFQLIQALFFEAYASVMELTQNSIFFGDINPSNILFQINDKGIENCQFISTDLCILENFEMYGSQGVNENFLYFGIISKRGQNELLSHQDCIEAEVYALLKSFSYFLSTNNQQCKNTLQQALLEAQNSNACNIQIIIENLNKESDLFIKNKKPTLNLDLFQKLRFYLIQFNGLVENLQQETHYQNQMLIILKFLNKKQMISEKQFKEFVNFLCQVEHDDFWIIKRTGIIEEFILNNQKFKIFDEFSEENVTLLGRIFIIFFQIFTVNTNKQSLNNNQFQQQQNSEIVKAQMLLVYGLQKLIKICQDLIIQIPKIYKFEKKTKIFHYEKELKAFFLNNFILHENITNFECENENQRLISIGQYLTDLNTADYSNLDTRSKLLMSSLLKKNNQYDSSLQLLKEILVTNFLWKKDEKNQQENNTQSNNFLVVDQNNSDHTTLMAKIYFEIAQNHYLKGSIRDSLSYAIECVNCFKNAGNNNLDFQNSPILPEIYTKISEIYFKFCNFQEAQSYQENATKIFKSIYGDNSMCVVQSTFKQAQLNEKIGATKQALDLYLQSLSYYMFYNSGENYQENEKLSEFLNQIAQCFESLGQFDEALNFHTRCLKIRIKNYSENSPLSAMSIYNIASLYKIQQSYQEAEIYHEQALPLIKNLFGNQHSSVYTLLSNLSQVKFLLGKTSEAAQIGRDAYDLGIQIYGANHPSLITILNHLAVVFTQLGQTKEAKQYKDSANQLKNQILMQAPTNNQ